MVILPEGDGVVFVWKVDFGCLAANLAGFSVVGSDCFFSGVEGTKTDSNHFSWVTNLSSPFAPWP